jgi:hypothetical protein
MHSFVLGTPGRLTYILLNEAGYSSSLSILGSFFISAYEKEL